MKRTILATATVTGVLAVLVGLGLPSLGRGVDERDAWERSARATLEEWMDAPKRGRDEARWLVAELLVAHPSDARLWQIQARVHAADEKRALARHAIERAAALAREGDDAASLAGILRDVARMRLGEGDLAGAIAADEELVALGVREHVAPALARLIPSLARAGRVGAAADKLAELDATGHELARIDPDVSWARAEIARKLAAPRDAARELLRFASAFPDDPRSPTAYVEASRALRRAGRTDGALLVIDSLGVDSSLPPELAAEAELLRGRLLEDLGRTNEASAIHWRMLADAPRPEQAARALERVVELEIEERGVRATLLLVAGLAEMRSGFGGELAASHFDALARAHERSGSIDEDEALFIVALATRFGRARELPAATLLRAAGVFERLGDFDEANALYALVGSSFGDAGREGRRGLARTGAGSLPRDVAPLDADRVLGLRRVLGPGEAARRLRRTAGEELARAPEARRLVAEELVLRGEPQAAAALLDRVTELDAREELLRADALAAIGRGDDACRVLESIDGDELSPSMQIWRALRAAACRLPDEGPVAAEATRRELVAILLDDPGEPLATMARDLLARHGWHAPNAPDAPDSTARSAR